MIGVAEISVVDEPDVSNIKDLVVSAVEELAEVLAGFKKI